MENLKKPYPYTARLSESYKTILFISWFIFIFVFLFRTENFPHNESTPYKLLYSFFYGLATFIVATTNIFIFSTIISPEKEKDWKVWNEIVLYLIQFISISIAIHFLSYMITSNDLSFAGIAQSILTTTAIGIIPVSIHILNQQRKLFKKYYEMAGDMGKDRSQKERTVNEASITLNSAEYRVNDILYIESNRNYLNVCLTENRIINIRFTLKEMENLLAGYPFFLRCHRAYIVNTNCINKVEGNAQGLKLYFEDNPSYVPVSRSYIPQIDHVIRPNR